MSSISKSEIGFSYGVPESPDRKWKSQINGRTYFFTKSREKSVFLYAREYSAERGATSFYSERDLPPEEIEKLRQFDHIIRR
jgi:YHS domain-containing protein